MKKYGKILLLFLTIILYSCQNSEDSTSECKYGSEILESRKREVSNFNKIKVQNFSFIYYTQADSTSIVIETDDNLHNYITTEVFNKKLIIRNSGLICPSHINIFITSPNLREIELSSPGSFVSKKRIETDSLLILLTSTSGNVTLNSISTDYFEALIESGGNVKAEGVSDEIYANIKGSASSSNKIDLKNLYGTIGTAIIEGTGEIIINVSEKLEASITGNGNIFYIGDPTEKDFDVHGTGTIERYD